MLPKVGDLPEGLTINEARRVIISFLNDHYPDWTTRFPVSDEREDIVAEAIINAVKTFDPDRGYKFTTYLCACARGQLRKTTEYNFAKMRGENKGILLFSQMSEENNRSLLDTCGGEDPNFIFNSEKEIIAILPEVSLRERERAILEILLDENNETPPTNKDIAKLLDISESRALQLRHSLIEKIREYIIESNLVRRQQFEGGGGGGGRKNATSQINPAIP